MMLDVLLPGLAPWAEVKANPVLWHVRVHHTPSVPEQLRAGRQCVDVRAGMFPRFTANSSAVTDADVTHDVTSYAAPQHRRAGMECFRAFPANEPLNQEPQSPGDVPIVLAGGDKTFGHLLPRMAEALRKHGCAHVTPEGMQANGRDVVDAQPMSVAALIARSTVRYNREKRHGVVPLAVVHAVGQGAQVHP